MADTNALVDQLSGLTVLEIAGLVKDLETKWGVSAAAPVAAAAPAGGGAAAAPAEEKTTFDVILKEMGSNKIGVIKEVFGARAYLIPVSSIKGVTGNALAAGGPFQVAACGLTMRDNIIAPTANYETADPDCDLDLVPNQARKATVNCALVNVRGIGGSASSLVVARVRS